MLTLVLPAAAGCMGVPSVPAASTAPASVPLVLDVEAAGAPAVLPALVERRLGIEWYTCADLLRALRVGKLPESVTALPQFNAYVDCLPPALMASGRGLPARGLDRENAGERLYRQLDLSTVSSSLAPQRPAEHYRLQDFRFTSVQVEPATVVLRNEAFAYEFKLLAVGDFRQLGYGELLVRFTERALNGGTYHRVSVLVVHAVPGGSTLVAVDALDVLRKQVATGDGS